MSAVNPEILKWSRETAGLNIDEAARKIGLGPARGASASERLAAMEAGDAEPSSALLRKMAEKYRRPLVAFFLDAVPERREYGIDFRTASTHRTPQEEALLATLLREVYAAQDLLRSALEDDEEDVRVPFVGSCKLDRDVAVVVEQVDALLDVSIEEYHHAKDAREAFRLLRRALERHRVFVILKGNLGSHHSAISSETFRGLSIADEIAPLIVINENDAPAAWSFTLIHELVHILRGQSGVSGSWNDREDERFCDDVAGEYLLPAQEITSLPIDRHTTVSELTKSIEAIAGSRNLSHSMIAYRAFRQGMISRGQLERLLAGFRQAWRESRRNENSSPSGSGPSYYVLRRHRVGDLLTETVKGLMQAGALSTTKAALILGVKPQNVGKLVGIGAT